MWLASPWLGQEALKQIGFTSAHQRELLKKVMVKAGIISLGPYAAKSASRLYRLTKQAIRQLDSQRKPRAEQQAG